MGYIIDIVDKNGEKIDCDVKVDVNEIMSSNCMDHIRIIIDNLETGFTDDELIRLLGLIKGKVEYGCPIEPTKKYIELYDKITDMLKRK